MSSPLTQSDKRSCSASWKIVLDITMAIPITGQSELFLKEPAVSGGHSTVIAWTKIACRALEIAILQRSNGTSHSTAETWAPSLVVRRSHSGGTRLLDSRKSLVLIQSQRWESHQQNLVDSAMLQCIGHLSRIRSRTFWTQRIGSLSCRRTVQFGSYNEPFGPSFQSCVVLATPTKRNWNRFHIVTRI